MYIDEYLDEINDIMNENILDEEELVRFIMSIAVVAGCYGWNIEFYVDSE